MTAVQKVISILLKLGGSFAAGYGFNELLNKDEQNDGIVDIYKSVGKEVIQSKTGGKFLEDPVKEDSVQIFTLIVFIVFGGIFLFIVIMWKKKHGKLYQDPIPHRCYRKAMKYKHFSIYK